MRARIQQWRCWHAPCGRTRNHTVFCVWVQAHDERNLPGKDTWTLALPFEWPKRQQSSRQEQTCRGVADRSHHLRRLARERKDACACCHVCVCLPREGDAREYLSPHHTHGQTRIKRGVKKRNRRRVELAKEIGWKQSQALCLVSSNRKGEIVSRAVRVESFFSSSFFPWGENRRARASFRKQTNSRLP